MGFVLLLSNQVQGLYLGILIEDYILTYKAANLMSHSILALQPNVGMSNCCLFDFYMFSYASVLDASVMHIFLMLGQY